MNPRSGPVHTARYATRAIRGGFRIRWPGHPAPIPLTDHASVPMTYHGMVPHGPASTGRSTWLRVKQLRPRSPVPLRRDHVLARPHRHFIQVIGSWHPQRWMLLKRERRNASSGSQIMRLRAIRIERGDADRLVVCLPYSPEDVAKIKTIPGRRWHPEGKYWTVPQTDGVLARLLALYAGNPVEVDPALRTAGANGDQRAPADAGTLSPVCRSPRSCAPRPPGPALQPQDRAGLPGVDRAVRCVSPRARP